MQNDTITCYCEERKKHPEPYKDIPEGYCGICDVCGKLGHMRAHPNSPTTGDWCDEHWNDLMSGRSFGLLELIWYIIVFISFAAGIVYWFMKLVLKK